ncbi:PP2C family protein-serine/threonine phosphatase [Marinobacter sp. F4206]|uniref:PP2C family protein-serine/threonine phosphatase n=1 Tax=Marinobacter sp. F4206 TaxID=2861777 RepID=UPI001C5CECA6|nr:fused response regulator/phosphatase [Marinobacter sp. F4206]MBW4933711.1 fused response regulator/phosphatase [Marinobacter sp. F4206]
MEESVAESRALRILIADDSDTDRLILKTLVKRLGHDVFDACNGEEAVRLFRESAPDIVLLDALMPVMDGMEAARQIKRLAGERMVPLIFLTSLSEAGELARCLDAGGDDFLSKPYNRIIIEAKINAFNRMRLMHQALSDQRDLIRERNQQLLEEQEVAKRVFDNVAHTGCLDAFNIRYHASPLTIFNGDVLFAAPRPAGGMLIFIGDFTGHGLPAAIGAMPMAEIFYGMAGKGFKSADVLREINQKLRQILPTGMFCCGGMIEADFKLNQLLFWNGGLPDGWLVRTTGEHQVLPSRHLPLGILAPDQFDAEMETLVARPGDRLLMMTDGFLESRNAAGETFGEAGITRALESRDDGQHPFDAVMGAVHQFTGAHEDGDDLTLCCLEMVDEAGISAIPDRAPPSARPGPTEWHCVYEIRERTLGDFSPLPLLLHICMEVPGLRRKSGEIYTLLAELYNNALEHGVLALPSDWKHSREGFGRYYEERRRRLARIEGHYIRFSLHHSMKPSGGRLRVICEDSGPGFDFRNHPVLGEEGKPGVAARYAGRGLLLLKRLSESVTFHQRGNHVEIIYDWDFSGASPDQASTHR